MHIFIWRRVRKLGISTRSQKDFRRRSLRKFGRFATAITTPRFFIMLAASLILVFTFDYSGGDSSGTLSPTVGEGTYSDQLQEWILELDPRRRHPGGHPLHVKPGMDTTQLDACPDRFAGHKNDASSEAWLAGDCPSTPPLSKVLTVVMVSSSLAVLQNVTGDISALHPNLTVLTVHQSVTNQSGGAGAAWSRLIAQVDTKYVLLARDLNHFSEDARLSRLLSVLSMVPAVDVAGGASRNDSGHWKMGCWQTRLTPYQLRLTEGYELSAPGESVYCDLIEGPLLTRTNSLKVTPLDEKLPSGVLFEDWLLRVKERGQLAVVCPDVMFYTGNISEQDASPISRRQQWRRLAQKWDLNVIHSAPSDRYTFGCAEVKAVCSHPLGPAHLLIPPCCYRELSRALHRLKSIFGETGIRFYIAVPTGSLSSGVEILQPPWTNEIDLITDISAIGVIQSNAQKIENLGFIISKLGLHSARIETSGFIINIRESNAHNSDAVSVVTFCGISLPVVVPQASSVNITQHAQECPLVGHHACCDQITVDDDENIFEIYSLYVQ